MFNVVSIDELCQALGVKYNTAHTPSYYLNMVRDLALHSKAAQQSVQGAIVPEDEIKLQADEAYERAKARFTPRR